MLPVTVNPEFGLAVGRAYMALPSYDAGAERAYEAFRDETMAQYMMLTRTLGIAVHATTSDPYPDAPSMWRDVDATRSLSVLASDTTGAHPFLNTVENDAFRAVHDYFGHYANRFDFSRHGEESAYRAHSLMYSPLARQALATETRGQNSAFIFINGGNEFPEQKFAILPEWARAIN